MPSMLSFFDVAAFDLGRQYERGIWDARAVPAAVVTVNLSSRKDSSWGI